MQSERQRDRFSGWARYERRRGSGGTSKRLLRAGFCHRFGTIRWRIARTREKGFLPVGLRRFQQAADEVSLLLREVFRGDLDPTGGLGGGHDHARNGERADGVEVTRDLDGSVRQFRRARLCDDYGYLFLDGVSLRVKPPTGRKQVQMLVAYGIRQDGSQHLLAFLRSPGEGQADWKALIQDL